MTEKQAAPPAPELSPVAAPRPTDPSHTGEPVRRQAVRHLEGHRDQVTAVAFSPDSRRGVSADREGIARVWDIGTGRTRNVLLATDSLGFNVWLTSIAFSPSGKQVLAGTIRPSLLVWDVDSGRVTGNWEGQGEPINDVAYSPDGRCILSCSQDNTMRVWTFDGGQELRRFEHPNWVTGLDVSPNGKQAVSLCADATLRLWEIDTGRLLAHISLGSNYEYPLSQKAAFSPDGLAVATSSITGNVDVWELSSARPLGSFEVGGNALDVVFSRDGRQVVAASGTDDTGPEIKDNNIHIWDLQSRAKTALLEGHTGNVNSLAVSPDGRYLLSGSSDKSVRLWTL